MGHMKKGIINSDPKVWSLSNWEDKISGDGKGCKTNRILCREIKSLVLLMLSLDAY